MSVYLVFLMIFFVSPTLVLWFFYGSVLTRYKKTYLFTVTPTFLFGVPWDTLSVVTGLWRYDSAPTLGIWFGPPAGGLPIEELFFTLIFPIFVVTVTLVVRNVLK